MPPTHPRAAPELRSIFSPAGPLAQAVPGYRGRPFQLEMAQAVAEAIAANAVLVAEAGTGTGKTFAYLVPALLSGGKVIISTGTKTLQDQLFGRDIPTVRDALNVPVTVALLKGRANYVCHYHLERALSDGRLPGRDDVRHLHEIERFARSTRTGDKADCAAVPESAGIWSYATSTRENCLGSQCPHYDACFVMRARRQALAADVVVVNHHLFFADVVLRDEGASELLPACNTVILDEAHQLPDTATLFFGEQVTAGQLTELARDAEIAARTTARDVPELPDAANELVPAIRKLRLALGETPGKFAQNVVAQRGDFVDALAGLAGAVDRLAAETRLFSERGEELAECAVRTADANARLLR